ncbi:hypothetical protein [Cyanothece sp. BG0011]|uniref:hypothetical protein n=1 Tax=Cyanothece sp. BG0011 TaxID=2082950 RepID=UPI0013002813|nr:hypothetical protein [Cyanothece sp. BG0011]
MSSSRAANGQIVAISDMATTLFAQGTGGQQIDVMEFSSETGTNGEVSAGGSSSFQISATTPG